VKSWYTYIIQLLSLPFRSPSPTLSFLPHRVPQDLLYLDVLQYSDELMGRLVRGEHVEVGSSEEVEIRGCSIWAVEVSSNHCMVISCFNIIVYSSTSS